MNIKMNLKEANKIIEAYERFEDRGCTCFQGNAPCAFCENSPSKELYEEALRFIEEN